MYKTAKEAVDAMERQKKIAALGKENLEEWGRLHRKYNTLGKKEEYGNKR